MNMRSEKNKIHQVVSNDSRCWRNFNLTCIGYLFTSYITEECLMVLLSVKEVIGLSFIKSGVRYQRTGRVRGHLRLGRIAVNLT